jgi:hypothetical protein
MLESLENNGGPTQTFDLLPSSLAIDTGRVALIPNGATTDQRGSMRVVNNRVDIGSVQHDAAAPCIHPDMLVETKLGIKKISDIVANDEVKTFGDVFIRVVFNIKFGFAKEFYKFAKDCLGPSMPNEDFYIHGAHPIYYNNAEVLPEKLIGQVDGVSVVELKNPVMVYSLCTSNRTFYKMCGELLVCTWGVREWNVAAVEHNIDHIRQ